MRNAFNWSVKAATGRSSTKKLYCSFTQKLFEEAQVLVALYIVTSQQTFVLMKTSWRRLEDVFRLRLQKTSWSRRLEDAFTTSWSRPRYLCWPYIFKTSSRRLQDIFKTFWRRLQDVFKTSSRLPAKISSRRFQGVPSS